MEILTLTISIIAIIFDIVLAIVLVKKFRRINKMYDILMHNIIATFSLTAKVDKIAKKTGVNLEPKNSLFDGINTVVSDMAKTLSSIVEKTKGKKNEEI